MFRKLPTFKSLPQAIGLPFLSTQEDAQLKFKSEGSGIKRLYGDEVISLSDVEYWSQYYTLFNSSADVYSLISVQDIRQALSAQPTNLANLIQVLSSHLFTLLPSPLFPTSPSNNSPQDPTREALNCLRVLGRILVVVYESEADARDTFGAEQEETFAKKYLWSRKPVEDAPRGTEASDGANGADESSVTEAGQFTIEDSDSEGEEDGAMDEGARAFKATVGNPPKQSQAADADESHKEIDDPLTRKDDAPKEDEEEKQMLPCLIDRLFSCTIDLLFCAGFTVSESVKGQSSSEEKINYVIWEKGVGSTVSIGTTAELDRNKTEVLRFLIILLSTTIYTPPNSLLSTPNLALEHLTHSLERRLVLSLLCSFLNTSLTRSKTTSTLGGQIPYNHLISKGEEDRRTLVRGCMTTLLVALDYRQEGMAQMGEGKDENAFRYFISKLHRKEDFAFVLGGITAIMEEHLAIQNGFLPGSQKPIPYILEAYMLLWRIVDLNKRFRAYLFDSGKAPDVIACILLTCLEMKDDAAHHGLLRLLSYLLQSLSADPSFASALGQTPRIAIPAKWAVAGSLADFLIVSIYSIATTPGLNPLFPALTISIANAAPYLQNIGVQASTRLLQLFKAFSTPSFLLADEGHPRLVYYLLETFNHILYHQLNENPNLVYAVLRSHKDFQTLATFTLMSGLRDIQRRQALKASAEAARAEERNRGRRSGSDTDGQAEKAALLYQADEDVDADNDPARSSSTPTRDGSSRSTPQILTTPGVTHTADPLSNAPVQIPDTEGSPKPLSEKARGKMRATSISSISSPPSNAGDLPDEELLKIAAAGVGPNGYIPTQEWVSSWQKGLPLDPVLVAISELLPKIQETQPRTGAPSSKVFNILKGASLSEVLPPATHIIPRKFQWSNASCIWLTSLLWGDIYVAGMSNGIWRDTKVRLFGVKQAENRGRGAQMGRMLKRLGVT